jgi:WD40 repeat protein
MAGSSISSKISSVPLKRCQFNSDGSALLLEDDARFVSVVPLSIPDMSTALTISETESIYDTQWINNLPLFITASKDQPVHMWNMAGQVHTSYSNLNQFHEIEAPYSIQVDQFNHALLCGLKHKINIFDLNTPGKEYTQIDLKEQIGGMISVIRFSEQYGVFAYGSFSGGGALFDSKSYQVWARLENVHKHGINDIRFAGNFLVSGGRKDNLLLQWDIRNLSEPIQKFVRLAKDNQRMYFDIDPSKQYLVTGCQSGRILAFDLLSSSPSELQTPKEKFLAHGGNVVNSVSISPQSTSTSDGLFARFASTSGMREKRKCIESSSEDEMEVFTENSLKVWDVLLQK